ncbi:sulfatase [Candidatus Hydrogenedentota bacterium]
MIKSKGTRRDFLRKIAIGATGLAFSSCALARVAKADRPNFVVIIGDDISVDDFGCYGHPNIRTPNVDKLAKEGVRFTNAYLAASQCSPTRCSVISGRYPHNSGGPELHQPLPVGQPMFPLELKKAGYYTVAAGKWHLGNYAKTGFDKVVSSKPGGEELWLDCLRERPEDKPFLMWFASLDAHRGWHPDESAEKHRESDAVIPPYMADMPGTRKDLALYYDEIQRLDRYVGLVVGELKQQNAFENTVFVFMADNGRPFPRCKTWLYDSGIKTPFVVRWSKGIAKPGVSDSLVSAIDIGPTVLDLAGLERPKAFQGLSFAPLLNDPRRRIREYAFAEHNWHDMEAHERMVRWKEYVYIRNARPQFSGWAHAHRLELSYKDLFALKKEGKLTPAQADVFMEPRPTEMLFNVEKDGHQVENLVDKPEHKETLAFLRKTMDDWQKRTGDTVPENLTPDRFDRKTFRRIGKRIAPPYRGTTPGSERNATAINDPGSR